MNKSKTWLKIRIHANPDVFESLENFFIEIGSTGTEEQKNSVLGYFPDTVSWDKVQSMLSIYCTNLRDLGFDISEPELKIIPSEDWSTQWRKHFKAIQITSKLVVKPPWESWPLKTGQTVVQITPRMAFGTGTHESTQICLHLLETYMRSGVQILDLGTGSGILAIAAAKIGAKYVLAVDNDSNAIQNTKENVRQNKVDKSVDIVCGSLESIKTCNFDLIMANINRMVMTKLMPHFHSFMQPEGQIILSGILSVEHKLMQSLFSSAGFRIQKLITQGEWNGYFLQAI